MTRPPSFTRVPPEFLASIATDSDRVPTLYFSRFGAVRRFFWMRLERAYDLAWRLAPRRRTVLDFGGGGGVFLPTLSSAFDRVTCVDLEDSEARMVVEEMNLDNVELVRADVATAELSDAPFDVIVAADVLEHFKDLEVPVAAIDGWLAPDGILVTSLPVEDRLYELLRRVFGVEKPWDHYHRAADVEAFLRTQGFVEAERAYVPFRFRAAAIYFVTAWRRRP